MKTESKEHSAPATVASVLRCPLCGHEDVQSTPAEETFTYGVGEGATQITVTVPVRTCARCGYQYTDDEAEDVRHEAVCRHLGVLTPREILALREKHGLSRAAFAALARVAEASLGRWERGALIQDGTADQLLYLLQFEDNIQRLRDRAGERNGSRAGAATAKVMKPELDGRAWLGKAEAYGTTFFVELFESRQHPGYYHFAMYCADDSFCDQSRRPMRAKEEDGVSFWTSFKDGLSKEHGLILDDLDWTEVKAEELPLSGERVKAGA
jgi:putative zinc finger/helix-turn-helix YgiT family protein